MSDIHAGQHGAAGQARYTPARAEPTGWVGWIIFAGVAMVVLGAFQLIEGLVAVFERGFYLVTASNMIVHVNYTAWGWTHFGIGCAVVITGLGVLAGSTWARVVGIALAVISAIISLAFIPAYPVWGIIVIALDVLVIYALAVHGREMKTLQDEM
jgi:hypothetical protein